MRGKISQKEGGGNIDEPSSVLLLTRIDEKCCQRKADPPVSPEVREKVSRRHHCHIMHQCSDYAEAHGAQYVRDRNTWQHKFPTLRSFDSRSAHCLPVYRPARWEENSVLCFDCNSFFIASVEQSAVKVFESLFNTC